MNKYMMSFYAMTCMVLRELFGNNAYQMMKTLKNVI